MSLDVITNFQNRIYSSLYNDKRIKNSVSKIYIGPTKDSKPPFIIIELVKISDLSASHINLYDIEFDVYLFAKDNNHNLLMELSKYINEDILKLIKSIDIYEVIGIKLNNIIFNKAKDLTLNKLSLKYKSSISISL